MSVDKLRKVCQATIGFHDILTCSDTEMMSYMCSFSIPLSSTLKLVPTPRRKPPESVVGRVSMVPRPANMSLTLTKPSLPTVTTGASVPGEGGSARERIGPSWGEKVLESEYAEEVLSNV